MRSARQKAHDVPDDEEIPGQVELRDDRQFVLDLAPHARRDPAVTLARAGVRQLAQAADGRLTGGSG